MSKQLKLRFKKIMKKAEFVHADLEYHEELIDEAQSTFQKAADELFLKLSDEEQSRLKEILEKKKLADERRAWERIQQLKKEDTDNPTEEEESTQLVSADNEEGYETDDEDIKSENSKASKLKKLFYRIAERAHPDKAYTHGLSDRESHRMEKIFKAAREAYTEENWYILYSIAVEMGLEIDEPTPEYIQWVDTDIRNTLAKITQLSNQVAWQWYIGNATMKQATLQHYFKQTYNFDYPSWEKSSFDPTD
jgi:hypothetical protein